MCFTFTKAQGGNVGKSLLEEDYLQYALDMIEKAKEKGVKLLLPVDAVAADEFSNDANIKVVPQNEIPEGWMGLDIGPETAKLYAEAVKSAKTVVWNGPMGCFEMPNFANGTETVAKALSETDAVTIIGGGDSAAAVNQLGYGDKMTHISTGGGASLEFLENKPQAQFGINSVHNSTGKSEEYVKKENYRRKLENEQNSKRSSCISRRVKTTGSK